MPIPLGLKSGAHGSHLGGLPYYSALLFVLGEAGPSDGYQGHHEYQRTTVQRDRAVLICGPCPPPKGLGVDLGWTSLGRHREHRRKVWAHDRGLGL